jgi:hypothetical protein
MNTDNSRDEKGKRKMENGKEKNPAGAVYAEGRAE